MNIHITRISRYHETLTLFWVYRVHRYLSGIAKNTSLVQLCSKLIHTFQNKNLPIEYYSQALLMSWDARNS
jgi:hypothetical protein